MRIGIDVTPLTVPSPGGIGTSLYETLRALTSLDAGHEYVLYACGQPRVPFAGTPLPFDLPVRQGSGLLAKSNIAWLQWGVSDLLRKDRIDVFWGTRHVLPRNAKGIGLAATSYDFWYATHPDQQPFLNRTANRYVTRAFMRDAHVVTAISDATADEARRLFPEQAGKVRTVLLGVDPAQFSPRPAEQVAALRERLGIGERYVLAMDTYNPRKNFSAIAHAVANVPGVDLVALGRKRATASGDDVESIAASAGVADRLRLPGDVSFDDLVTLYSGAAAFVYPSVYEGFGMPVLEAMACGAPVVCSNTSSLPQVAGDAAILVDPTDAAAIAAALERVLDDAETCERMVAAGLRRAHELTWQQTAQGMLNAFSDAATAAGARR